VNTRHLANQRSDAEVASVVLVCTACQHTWEPGLLDPTDRSEATSTGCRLCGGWTWIGQITEPDHGHRSTATPSIRRRTTR
jgi:hypothetical protein